MDENYFKSESYLRGANNDLMDPNWRPVFKSEVTPLSLIENLISSFLSIEKCFDTKFGSPEDESMNKNPYNYGIQISFTYDKYLEIQKAIKEYKEFNKPKTQD